MKILGKLLLTAGILFGSSRIYAATTALKVGSNLNVNLNKPRIHRLNPNPFGGGIEIRLEVELQNPTSGSLEITQPFIQLLSSDSIISSTVVSSKKFILKPLSKITLDTISFIITWPTILSRLSVMNSEIPNGYNLIQKVSWIISNYKQIVTKLKLAVKYSTDVNGLYYSDIQKLNF